MNQKEEILQGFLIGLEHLSDEELLDALPKVAAFSLAVMRGIGGTEFTDCLVEELIDDDTIVVIKNGAIEH